MRTALLFRASRTKTLVALLVAVFASPAQAAGPATGAEIDFFERQIRPILLDHCISCHGPKKQKSGLRLDTREGVFRGGKEGVVVLSGKPQQSRLIEAVKYSGELRMPPSGKLTERDIQALEKWIALGVPFSEGMRLESAEMISRGARTHWAFQPIVRPALPVTRNKTWARTFIDDFILARLEAANVQPSPQADKRTLIRRATYDLLGLPPTVDEVAAFERDTSPDAYERLIDRLLSSPHYGERWGRHWLDVARYADNKGYVFFEDTRFPWAFTYRDYVIEALNSDLPYDRFIVEQLAADQLPGSDGRTLAALGFLTVGGHFMNNTHDIIDDRIDVTTRGLMGLTVVCARCHDHKFDPLPQSDYYSLYGVFRSCYEPTVPPLWQPLSERGADHKHVEELRASDQKLKDFVTTKHRELVSGARARVGDYLMAAQAARGQPPADEFMLIADRGDLNPTMVTRWRNYLAVTRKQDDPIWSYWNALADLPTSEFAKLAGPVCGRLQKEGKANQLVRDAFVTVPRSLKEAADRYGAVFRKTDSQWLQEIARKLATHGESPTCLADPDAERLRQVLYGERSPADAPLALDWGFLSLFPDRATQEEYKKLLKEVETLSAKGPPRAMVLFDSPRLFDPQIFERGQPGQLGEHVPRQSPRVVNPNRQPFTQGSGRLQLAREIVSRQSPLTARVFVNRVWLHHFGVGLVRTPGDFGLRSEPPTHPDLLDALASDFVDRGWSIKQLHRQIMNSAAYRQTSNTREDGNALDPENRLLWRMNRQRLDFESLHDTVLTVSGSLNRAMGGPPVALLSGKHRRAIYGVVDRLEFPSLLSTFDVPNPAISVPDRLTTTVAPQALFWMNGSFVRSAAQHLAAAISHTPASSDKRLEGVFMMIYGREPDPEEAKLAQAFLMRGPEIERWADLVHGLMMTNEFAFVD